MPQITNFFTSLPLAACWVAHTSHLYVVYCSILLFPKYLRDVQGFNIKQIGDLAALPQVLTVFVIFGGSYLADKLSSHGFKLILIRRVINFCGSVIPALVLGGFYFVECNIVGAMAIMITVQTLAGLQHSSSKVFIYITCML